jgi:hypothetical protein
MRYLSSNFSFNFFPDTEGGIEFSPMSPREAWEWLREDRVANIVKPTHALSASIAQWATGNPPLNRGVTLFEGDELLIMFPPQRNQRPEWDYCRFILVSVDFSGRLDDDDEDS